MLLAGRAGLYLNVLDQAAPDQLEAAKQHLLTNPSATVRESVDWFVFGHDFSSDGRCDGKKEPVDPMALSTRFAAHLRKYAGQAVLVDRAKDYLVVCLTQPLRTRLGRVWFNSPEAGLRELSVKARYRFGS